MVALSLQAPKIPQKKGDNKTEKTHESTIRNFNSIYNNLRGYLRHVILRAKRWQGVTR